MNPRPQWRKALKAETFAAPAAAAAVNLRRVVLLGAALAGVLVHGPVEVRHVAVGILLPIVLSIGALIALVEQWQHRDLVESLTYSAIGACISFTLTSSLIILASLAQH